MMVSADPIFIERQKVSFSVFQQMITSEPLIQQIMEHIFGTIMCKVDQSYSGKIIILYNLKYFLKD